MYLQNIEYSNIYFYLQELEEEIKNGLGKRLEYKSYDKSINDIIEVKCFDFKRNTELNSIFIKELKYFGMIEFSYNKKTNELLVANVPYIILNNTNIPIFTSDIAEVIIKLLSKHTDISNVKINFINKFAIIAMDCKVCEVIPDTCNTKNYKLLQKILSTIDKEIKFIERDIKKQHDKLLREDRKREEILREKSKVCGINVTDFEDINRFDLEVNRRLCISWENRCNNLKRHLDATKKKYKKMLLATNKISEDEVERQVKVDVSLSERSVLSLFRTAKEDYHSELKGARRVGHSLEDEEYSEYLREYHYYPFFLNYMNELGIRHPIFTVEKLNKDTMETFRLAFNYLEQIDYLQKSIDYYKKLLENPSEAFLNFKQFNSNWNGIIHLPYFLRYDKDTYRNMKDEQRDTFALLMVSPGVHEIDYNQIRMFNNDKDKKRRFVLDNDYIVDRLIVCIPKSLSYKEIKNIIIYGLKHGIYKNFVCEDLSVMCIVKQICIDIYLNEDIKDSLVKLYRKYISLKNKCSDKIYYEDYQIFVNLDPDYYRSYFIDTPCNKEYWHRFDYTSYYKFRRKNAMSFTDELVEAIVFLKEYGIDVNEKNVKELILGGYLGEDKFAELRGRYYEGINDINKFVIDNNYNIRDYDLVKQIDESMRLDRTSCEHLRNTKYFIANGYYVNNSGRKFYFDGENIYKDEIEWIETKRKVIGKSIVCRIRKK